MEQKMLEHAKNLEFEEAAALRDEVTELKQVAFAGSIFLPLGFGLAVLG
jgi:excinuclease ABC subunit B